MTDIQKLQAIDIHAHFGTYARGDSELIDRLSSGDAQEVVRRAKLANVAFSIVSPLAGFFPRGNADAVTANDEAYEAVVGIECLGRWVIANPLQPETYDQAARMLTHSRCFGIKIHPEEHGYAIKDHGRAIFEFAAKHGAVVLTHSGEAHSMPEDCVRFADDFAEVTLILAHLGYAPDGDPTHQVRAVQASRHGNVYADTSSARNVVPGLLEWAVKEVGPDRLLFGTDSPLYWAPMQRARIDSAEIDENAKRMVLRDNAIRILDVKLPS